MALVASSPMCVSAAQCEPLKLPIALRACDFGTFGANFGRGGAAFAPSGCSGLRFVAEKIDPRLRVFRLSERAPDLDSSSEEADSATGASDEADVGRNSVLSLLAKSVSVGVLALTVAAVALVSRNRRPDIAATGAALVSQMCGVGTAHLSSAIEILPSVANRMNEDSQVMRKTLSGRHRASRSLLFASTSLSNGNGLTVLENKKIDDAGEEFVAWVDEVKREALREGVSEGVLKWALQDVKVSKPSVVHRKTAPEVKLKLDDYLRRMVVEQRVAAGASRLKENIELLTEISQKFGVPSQFLVAIWGIETSYGSFTGTWDVIQSLATMGFTEEEAYRRKYFRGELLEALVMLQNGTGMRGAGPQEEKRLLGSWAGAMGQCQFMPTSFRDYAIDFDGDGRKDIWESKADIFASIANYFKEHGWQTGGPLFQKVQVPDNFDKKLVNLEKSVQDWELKHGVVLKPVNSPLLPRDEMARLVMPNGPKGAAYLVCKNFRVILRYNTSDLYAFAVCELARLIQERASNPYPTPQL